MKAILKMIDYFIRRYIGLDKQETIPDALEKTGNKVVLLNTESFKRHVYPESWERFLSRNFEEISESTKQKIGISMGKSLAKNLIISFDKVQIRR